MFRNVVELVRRALGTAGVVEPDEDVQISAYDGDRETAAWKRQRTSIVDKYFEMHHGKIHLTQADCTSAYERAPVAKLPDGQNLLTWWNATGHVYGDLSKIAVMLMPATSATCERLLSTAGRVLEDRHQNLSFESFDAILFLRSLYRFCGNDSF